MKRLQQIQHSISSVLSPAPAHGDMASHAARAAQLQRYALVACFALCITLVATGAWAGPFDGIKGKLSAFNTEIMAVAGVVTVTGFAWAVAAVLIGIGGAGKAIMCIVAGLVLSQANAIVGIFIPS